MEKISHSLWNGKTGGKPWMLKTLISWFRWMDIRISYFLMGWVVPFYMIFSHQGYISMYHFFRQRLHYSILKSFWYVYLNHFKFGQIILDRFAVYAGKSFQFDIEGYNHFTDLASKEGGFIQLSSHVGNYELAGYSLVADKKRFNALVFSGEKETVMNNRNRILSKNNIYMVKVKDDLSHVFILNAALNKGEIVSMPGDRIYGSQKYAECPFFGAKAKFPLGPFAMAVLRDVPVLAVFVMKESAKRYKIFVQRLILDDSEKQHSQEMGMNDLANAFAFQLETIVRRYPTQWFNYYDFWKQ